MEYRGRELYRLFHEVNSLAAILSARAENEEQSRKFLQNTISDIFHQLKTTFAMKESRLTVFRRRNSGFIFQAFNLIPELTVEQNIIFPMLLDYQKPDRDYLEELLGVLNLKERRNHLPSQLSGGQQQRVDIGRARITKPSLILADEPTGNLDTQNSNEVITLLREASRKYGQTIIMITHNRMIAQTADRLTKTAPGDGGHGDHQRAVACLEK